MQNLSQQVYLRGYHLRHRLWQTHSLQAKLGSRRKFPSERLFTVICHGDDDDHNILGRHCPLRHRPQAPRSGVVLLAKPMEEPVCAQLQGRLVLDVVGGHARHLQHAPQPWPACLSQVCRWH